MKKVTITVQSDDETPKEVVFNLEFPGDQTMQCKAVFTPAITNDTDAEYANVAACIFNALKNY